MSEDAADIDRLRDGLRQFDGAGTVKHDWIWTQGRACKVIDCVLSLRRPYYSVVEPRVRAFAGRYGASSGLGELSRVLAAHASPREFARVELAMDSAQKGEAIAGVAARLLAVAGDDDVSLAIWAKAATPADARLFGVKHFGLAGFQYLRMLFGADTAKPDQHVIAFVESTVGRRVEGTQALTLLERASFGLPLSIRALDMEIWEQRARAAGTFVNPARPATEERA